ncbi:DUF637 domain-containing protein [Stutzerimonas nitrititolerans]|uniref:DUF637 domain-containing protein n=1 Tax=Stutzerimonas nitrititolerans TaxID=2482751 RepID=UPI00289EADA8|nr:DUF637 domain-containing protein [Stutzerimonas nitrititolerans]
MFSSCLAGCGQRALGVSSTWGSRLASTLRAGEEAYLYAGGELNLLASQNSDYSLYDMKSKGSWGSKKTQRDETTTVRNIGSTLTTGGDLTLVSEGDQRYQNARLESGNDLTLDSGGAIAFEAVKDLDQESHEKSKSGALWQSAKGKGTTDETVQQSVLIAKGETVIRAVEGLQIDIKHVDQQTVSQTIDAMVQADPELAWLKEMEQRGDVDWRRVKEVHDSFKYSHSGLGGAAQLVIAIIVTYLTAGAGAALTGATSAAGIAASNVVVSAAASNAAISTINNRGDLGAVFKDVTSSDALKGYAVSGITAGLTAGVYDGWTGTETASSSLPSNSGLLANSGAVSGASNLGRFAANQILQNGTSAILSKALGLEADLGDALQNALASTFAAAGFNLVGDLSAPGGWNLQDGSLAKVGLHAVMGGLAAEAAGGDFKTGALAAGVNELLVDSLAQQYSGMDEDQKKSLLVMNSQVIGVLAAAAQGGDAEALQTGAWVAGSATQYNYLGHQELDALEAEARTCSADGTCEEVKQKFRALSVANDDALGAACSSNPAGCVQIYGDLLNDRLSLQERLAGLYFDDSIPALFKTDLHVYQMQNQSAISTLTHANTQAGLEAKGLSPEAAALAASVLGAAAGGGVPGKQGAKGVGRSVDELSQAAATADRGGLTAAGRALQKHGGREGSAFPAAKGNPLSINQQGQHVVDDILTTPGSTMTTRHHARFGEVTEVRAPDGRGLRYGPDGKLIGFLEP